MPQTAENCSFIEFLLCDWLMTIKMDKLGQSYYSPCLCECLFSFLIYFCLELVSVFHERSECVSAKIFSSFLRPSLKICKAGVVMAVLFKTFSVVAAGAKRNITQCAAYGMP